MVYWIKYTSIKLLRKIEKLWKNLIEMRRSSKVTHLHWLKTFVHFPFPSYFLSFSARLARRILLFWKAELPHIRDTHSSSHKSAESCFSGKLLPPLSSQFLFSPIFGREATFSWNPFLSFIQYQNPGMVLSWHLHLLFRFIFYLNLRATAYWSKH